MMPTIALSTSVASATILSMTCASLHSAPSLNPNLVHQIPTIPIDYTDDFYDMTGDVTTNHTRITPPIDLISSTDNLDSFESALPPVLDTTFDSSFLDNLDIPCLTKPDYWDSFFDATTSRIIYHSFLDSSLEYNISASDINDSVVAPRHTIALDIDFKSKRK
jgi:hypothetical protein